MPTVNLEPNADVSNSPAWTLTSGSDVRPLIGADYVGFGHLDSDYIYATAYGKIAVVQFEDFDSSGVASIDSVQAVIRTVNQAKGQAYDIGMTIGNNGTGSASWAKETLSQTSTKSYVTKTFTARTTSTSGGSAWTDTDVDNITMAINLASITGGTTQVTYAYFIVTYTEAAVAAGNAIFFGTNF